MAGMGAVAAGDTVTADAAAEILQDGGTAVDAALAALMTACTAEPVLASLGGGGFLLVRTAEGRGAVYDFFAQTPLSRRPDGVDSVYPVHVDFGPDTQEFHIGLGTAAVPGVVAGLFAAHADHGRLPMARLAEPAIRAAGKGVPLSPMQATIAKVVAPILTATPEARALFGDPETPGATKPAGSVIRFPALADVLDALAHEGPRLFYEGEIAGRIVQQCAQEGGHLTADDLRRYACVTRRPLDRPYGRARLLTNPPPSLGGLLIAFTLALLEDGHHRADGHGGLAHLSGLARALAMTGEARRQDLPDDAEDDDRLRLLDPGLIGQYRGLLDTDRPLARRGTTHISVVDRHGAAASLTVSNGEGCGAVDPALGFMLNNMLGEEDLNPNGIGAWRSGTRMASMMAPSVVVGAEGDLLVLGSGGSNRIRSAILQALVNRLDFGLPLEAAIAAPRLHVEGDRLHLEAGPRPDVQHAVAGRFPDHKLWPEPSLFFGGVNAVQVGLRGGAEAAADPRRGGAARVV